MLKVTFLELLVRGLPEAFIMILATYTLANKKVEKKEYLISSLIMALLMYLFRMLPISYGVHTILNIFLLIFLTFSINKIDLMISIKSSILILMILFICEGLNILFIQFVLHKNLKVVFGNPISKIILGIPSTIAFLGIVIMYYLTSLKKGKLK